MVDNNLFLLREYYDHLQKDIGQILGVSQRTYSSWETGTILIPLKHLNTLCNYYHVSMDYVLKLSPNKTYPNMQEPKELNKQAVGQRIRSIRKSHNLTLRAFAQELNTTHSNIYAYETGKNLITIAFALELCLKFHISLDWLCNRI